MALCVITVVVSGMGIIKRRRESPDVAAGEGAAEGREAELQKFVSFPFALFMLAIFVYAIIVATSWTQEGGRIVKAFAYPGAVFCGVMVIMDIREFLLGKSNEFTGSIANQYLIAIRASKEPMGVLGMYGWFAGIIAVTYVTGQLVSLPLFVFLYLKVQNKETWTTSLIYTFCSWLLLWGMFGEIIHIVWQPPLLDFLPQ